MKKTALGLLVLLLLLGAQSASASVIVYDHWRYYSGVWADGDWQAETDTRDPVEADYGDDNLGRAKSGKFTLKSEARASSDGLRYAESISLFYTRMKLTGGVDGEDNPALVEANLRGVLRVRGDFNSSIDSFVMAYDHNVGFGTILDSIHNGDDLPDAMWEGSFSEETSEDRIDVNEYYNELIDLQNEQYVWILAGLRTTAQAEGSRSIADFFGPERSFDISITPLSQPPSVPEPASLSFLGLGLLGLVRKFFKKV